LSVTNSDIDNFTEIQFFIDDSLDYIDGIEAAIKNGENPLK